MPFIAHSSHFPFTAVPVHLHQPYRCAATYLHEWGTEHCFSGGGVYHACSNPAGTVEPHGTFPVCEEHNFQGIYVLGHSGKVQIELHLIVAHELAAANTARTV
jgi:hypothetical protein